MAVRRFHVLAASLFLLTVPCLAQSTTNAVAPLIGFVDISMTGGTPISGVGDDTVHFIQTTIGNALFPSGSVLVSANGVAISGLSSGSVGFTNNALPMEGPPPNMASGGGGYILAFWDDLRTISGTQDSTVWWQEMNGTLFIMWKGIGRFGTTVAGEEITFEIQVFGSPTDCGPSIQIVYPDTIFGGSSASSDDGASATIGYASGLYFIANSEWGFNTAGAVTSGSTISVVFPAYSLVASSPLGPGSLQIDFTPSPCAGPISAYYIFPVTFSPTALQDGWLFGLNISFFELANELAIGHPFTGPVSSEFHFGPFTGMPPATVSGVVILTDPSGNVLGHSGLMNHTIP